MRLPGSRYQEHGWERVRKLLARSSAAVLQAAHAAQAWPDLLDEAQSEAQLAWFCEALMLSLNQQQMRSAAQAAGNSYGESVAELALSLALELRCLPSFWASFVQGLRQDPAVPAQEARLIKRLNDLWCNLRDRVDADQFQIACGQPCSPNKIYTYRMLDTACHEIARIFCAWPQTRQQIEAILQRDCQVQPIEVARLRQSQQLHAQIKADWIIRWSASLADFGKGAGPLHTRSKRFASLKNQPDKIAAMLAELADYQHISQSASLTENNSVLQDLCQLDAEGDWLDDLQRVLQESALQETAATPEPGDLAQWAQACQDGLQQAWHELEMDDEKTGASAEWEPASTDGAPDDVFLQQDSAEFVSHTQDLARRLLPGVLHSETPIPLPSPASARALCEALSLPPDYLEEAARAEDCESWCFQLLAQESIALRLALYLHLLGPYDICYPQAWLDPRTGALPTCKQLAGLARVSLPTFRKKRAQALNLLQQAYGLPQAAPARMEAA
ncbi:hypothetical protein V8J88_15200 [Massilia sp. W12]|uniref:hypothetical protein n=1 Tax=Massilia sp. W12 TaxID=3126507 RepID=UPI0030D608B1